MTATLLQNVWYVIICAELALYILLDGGNLGVGILSLLPQKEEERSRMLQILGPIWNANETWLLVAAGSLFGAFPLVYSIGLNALYVPGMVIVVGLIGRAVAFEFHVYTERKVWWSKIFGVSSVLVALGQGMALGGLLSGITIAGKQFAGSVWDFATPLTLLITVGILCSYLVLGYAYLIRVERYANEHESFGHLLRYAVLTFAALLLATIFLPQTNYLFFSRWSTPPAMYALWGIALAIVAVSLWVGWELWHKRHPERLYFLCLGLFVLGTAGMLVGTYPYMLPPTLTIADAASAPATQQFMLWGIGPLLPIILAYNWYLHRIFRNSFVEEK